ncbi:MAG: glnEb [Nitrospira sp.]|nr:glnEb [Nitrospira sp.]
MADRGHEHRNVKLGTGGIREIEFLAQTIQVLAGKQDPALLHRSTLDSLKAFARKKLLSTKERDALSAAYLFLRDIEHKLQMVHDLQTHSLPDEALELERCAVRSGYQGTDRPVIANRFQADYRSHTKVVHDLFRSFFYETQVSPLLKATLKAMAVRRGRLRGHNANHGL